METRRRYWPSGTYSGSDYPGMRTRDHQTIVAKPNGQRMITTSQVSGEIVSDRQAFGEISSCADMSKLNSQKFQLLDELKQSRYQNCSVRREKLAAIELRLAEIRARS